jgi:DNA-directed RNA polymerase specialized sigma24 family protein
MTPNPTTGTIASLMARFRCGDREAADQLFSLLYPELRRLAAIKMNADLPSPASGDRSERDHFLQFAGHVMRHLLIDHSRLLSKRTLKIDIAHFDFAGEEVGTATLQEIDDLLEKLSGIHPRLRSIVEMKVFEGLLVEEIADRLEIAPRTVARNWAFCKKWLREQLEAERRL